MIIMPEIWCMFWICIPGPRGNSKNSSTWAHDQAAPIAVAARQMQSTGPGRHIPQPTYDQWAPGRLPCIKHMYSNLGLDPAVNTAQADPCVVSLQKKSLCGCRDLCARENLVYSNQHKGPTLHCGIILAPLSQWKCGCWIQWIHGATSSISPATHIIQLCFALALCLNASPISRLTALWDAHCETH